MKEFLSRKGVTYQVKDVTRDRQAMQELVEMGYQAVPVTVIGTERILGTELDRIEKALAG
ncbi:MAG: glutaredoxin family protein [Planctomycetes bacterium]|nr:glutaredoxin family protein [Planctomycetota bacterium]